MRITTREARAGFRRHADGLRALPADDRRSACVLSQPDRRRSDAGPVAGSDRHRQARSPRALSRHRLSGFRSGIEEDGAAVRMFAESGMTFLVSSSFSKSFSLYGERVGALTIVDQSQDESTRVLSQLKRVIRANYSTPPTHGGHGRRDGAEHAGLRAEWERNSARCAAGSRRCAAARRGARRTARARTSRSSSDRTACFRTPA